MAWGLWHGCLVIMDRLLKTRFHIELWGIVGWALTFLAVMFGWLLFRAESFSQAWQYLTVMFGFEHLQGFQYYTYEHFIPIKTMLLSTGCFLFSVYPWVFPKGQIMRCVKAVGIAVLLVLSMAFMADASFSPFIYFQF